MRADAAFYADAVHDVAGGAANDPSKIIRFIRIFLVMIFLRDRPSFLAGALIR